MSNRKKKRSKILRTSAKKVVVKSEQDRIAVELIYLTEMYQGAIHQLNREKRLNPELKKVIQIRLSVYVDVLLNIVKASPSFIQNIVDVMKEQPTWADDVDAFVEKQFGAHKLQAVSSQDLENELAQIFKKKDQEKKLKEGSSIGT